MSCYSKASRGSPSDSLKRAADGRAERGLSGRLPTGGLLCPISLLKIIPTKICWLKLSKKFPMGITIPHLTIKIMLESNPLKSRILVRRLAAPGEWPGWSEVRKRAARCSRVAVCPSRDPSGDSLCRVTSRAGRGGATAHFESQRRSRLLSFETTSQPWV